MYTTLNLQLVSAKCPKGMNEKNCPVRQYIENEPELFVPTINENLITLARAYGDARGKYEGKVV